jgi:hypothetical protein
MLVARCLLIVKFGLLVSLVGCITPQYHYGPGGPGGAANSQGADGDDVEVETLIHVDSDGNISRGDDSPKKPSSPKSSLSTTAEKSARRTTTEQGDNLATKSRFNELAEAIDEPRVDSVRVAELMAAHERVAAATAENVAATSTVPPQQREPAAALPATVQVNKSTPEASLAPLPAGVFPTVVRTTRFELEYDDEVLGDGGIAKVELYGTRDAGRTWEKLGEDEDCLSPYTVEMPDEGVYGFRIAIAGKNGLASRPPANGELPELWVRVDLSEPMFRANLRPAGEVATKAEAEPSSHQTNQTDAGMSATVAQASHTEPAPAESASTNWREHLQLAIEAAEKELADSEEGKRSNAASPHPVLSAEERRQASANLRMLYLAAGRHNEAITSSPHDDVQQNEFWSHELLGLKLLVESSQAPAARQASAALAELRSATDKLAAMSELQIKSLVFCTAANSFGVYETKIAGSSWKHDDYAQRKFEPQQPIVLYFEVDNFASEQTISREHPDGAWRTSLRGSYTIVDSSGSPVEQRELKLKDDLCRNRRHDYYVAYKSWIPQLNPGQYSLELLVEDTIAGKIGTSSIDFEVVAK